MNEKYKKIIYSAILLLIFITLTYVIKYYFKPFFIIILLVLLCMPIYKFLSRNQVFNNQINAIISIMFINVFLFILIFLIGYFLVNKVYIITVKGTIDIDFYNLLKRLTSITSVDFVSMVNKIESSYSNIVNSGFFKKGVAYTTEGIFAYFIANIVTYFILVDKYVIVNSITKFIGRGKIVDLKEKVSTLKNMLNIEVKLVGITTIETLFGFLVLGISNAIILSLICSILDILPYIGTALIFLPMILYEVIKKKYFVSIGLVILYILLVVSRQIMEMKFMSNKLKIHPILIVVSLYIGIKAFGIIGMFMGPLYVIMVKEIIIE